MDCLEPPKIKFDQIKFAQSDKTSIVHEKYYNYQMGVHVSPTHNEGRLLNANDFSYWNQAFFAGNAKNSPTAPGY